VFVTLCDTFHIQCRPHIYEYSETQMYMYVWGKSLWYSLDMRLGGPENWSGWHREEKNLAPTRTQISSTQPSSL
jgi:hypothetical protein